MMRVLVTGCHGYIGSVLMPMLVAEGHDAVGLDTDFFKDCTFGRPAATHPCMQRDVRDVHVEDLRGFDSIVHLAALSNDPLGNLSPDLTAAINHRASVQLARLAKEAGVKRFVFSSSCSTYGVAGDQILDEEAEFNPATPYGKSKVLAEHDLALLADDDFTPVFLRNATAYGPSPRLRLDLVINDLVANALVTGIVLIKSDGTPWRPLVHVEDICRAFLAVLVAPREAVHNQAFNIGQTKENYRVRELAEIVRDTVPASRIEFATEGGPDTRCYRVCCDKVARVVPQFQPQWDVRRGAQQLYEAFRAAGLSADDVNGPRYVRLKTLNDLIRARRLDSDLWWQPCGTAAK